MIICEVTWLWLQVCISVPAIIESMYSVCEAFIEMKIASTLRNQYALSITRDTILTLLDHCFYYHT